MNGRWYEITKEELSEFKEDIIKYKAQVSKFDNPFEEIEKGYFKHLKYYAQVKEKLELQFRLEGRKELKYVNI